MTLLTVMVLVLRDDAYGAGFRIRVDYSAA